MSFDDNCSETVRSLDFYTDHQFCAVSPHGHWYVRIFDSIRPSACSILQWKLSFLWWYVFVGKRLAAWYFHLFKESLVSPEFHLLLGNCALCILILIFVLFAFISSWYTEHHPLPVFNKLKESYSLSLQRDPSFSTMMGKIAHLYYGVRPQGDMFGNLFSSLFNS